MPATDETRRLSLRIDRDLKQRVAAAADARGQSLTVFVERALRAALSGKAPVPPIGQDAENERAHRDAQPERILERPTPRQMPRSETRLQSYEPPEPPRPPDAKAPRDARDAGTPLLTAADYTPKD